MGQDENNGREPGLPDSVETLIMGCRDGVHRLIRRRMRRKPHDIDDIAQETYLRLLRLVPRGTLNNPEAYVKSVATNVMNDFDSRDARDRGRLSYNSDELAQLSEADADAWVNSLQDAVEAEQELARVTKYLRPKLLAALILCEREGFSYEEAAQKLGVSPSTIKQWLTEARAHCAIRASKR